MKKIIYLTIIAVICSCTSGKVKNNINNGPASAYKIPGSYNFKFIAIDKNINNPDNDKRSYYKIFIDKVDKGFRTSIGLESQDKVFTTKLNSNRHLLKVEKYRLDTKKGRYVKLNNIHQPKPAYTYFEVPEGRIVLIKLVQDAKSNKAEFVIDYEMSY